MVVYIYIFPWKVVIKPNSSLVTWQVFYSSAMHIHVHICKCMYVMYILMAILPVLPLHLLEFFHEFLSLSL